MAPNMKKRKDWWPFSEPDVLEEEEQPEIEPVDPDVQHDIEQLLDEIERAWIEEHNWRNDPDNVIDDGVDEGNKIDI